MIVVDQILNDQRIRAVECRNSPTGSFDGVVADDVVHNDRGSSHIQRNSAAPKAISAVISRNHVSDDLSVCSANDGDTSAANASAALVVKIVGDYILLNDGGAAGHANTRSVTPVIVPDVITQHGRRRVENQYPRRQRKSSS